MISPRGTGSEKSVVDVFQISSGTQFTEIQVNHHDVGILFSIAYLKSIHFSLVYLPMAIPRLSFNPVFTPARWCLGASKNCQVSVKIST